MVQAWFMDDSKEDQREPHKLDPSVPVSVEELAKIGVLTWHWPEEADAFETSEKVKKLREERGYDYSDVINISPDTLPNYETRIKAFFEEHLHTDEEIRFIVDGSGYFDVRNANDKWVRIAVAKGDLLVLPAGIYHRFTLDTNNYAKANRLFKGVPVWTPHNRPQDETPARKAYVATFLAPEAATAAETSTSA